VVLVHAFLRVFSFSPAIISSIIHQNPRIIKKKKLPTEVLALQPPSQTSEDDVSSIEA